MNVAKTNTIAQPVKPETVANNQKAKDAQQQRLAQTTVQETQKTREARPEQGLTGGEINITA
jgi:hypothetical protein